MGKLDKLTVDLLGIESSEIEVSLKYGKLIVEAVWGSLEKYRTTKRSKKFNEYIKNTKLPYKEGALRKRVALYALSERLPIRNWPSLGIDHFMSILNLDKEDQIRLLDQGVKENWSIIRIREEVKKWEEKVDSI